MFYTHFPTAVLGAILFSGGFAIAAEEKEKKPCTVHSAKTGSFFDLRELSLSLDPDGKSKTKNARTESWRTSGYDYGVNFTMNFCAPVLEDIKEVHGVSKSLWQNVSAYYEHKGQIFSIGQESSNLTFRGRKLILQYTNGSPCGPSTDKRSDDSNQTLLEDSNRSAHVSKAADSKRRKSTLISFSCEKDPLAAGPVTSFVGTDPDECAYFFEVRSQAACGGAEPIQTGTLGPGGVFGIIALVAIIVYFAGGVVYQRNVAHARGWRQLPNYSFWAGIGNFFSDMFVIATSSCARFIPRKRGYSSVANGNGYSSRSGRPEDENRLIDQLDEEWDD